MNRKELEKELDKHWSALIKSKADFTCEKCSASDCVIDPHHIIGRRYKRLRHLSENGIALCRPCHREAHDHPENFMQWFKEFHQQEHYYLHLIRQEEIAPITLDELEQSLEVLKIKMKLQAIEDVIPF